MNYAESLTYWYLRLNGFFPITNFVLHQPYGKGQNTDCDVLAVRFPFSQETISNDRGVLPCDTAFFQGNKIDLGGQVTAIIAQVKSGRYKAKDVKKGFDKNQLFYSLNRIGMFQPGEVEGIAERLASEGVYRDKHRVVATLLVDTEKWRAQSGKGTRNWLKMTVDQAEAFITDRFHTYSKHKSGARMFFGGDLVQYLAWKSGVLDESEEGVE